jgi:hypothetical protein
MAPDPWPGLSGQGGLGEPEMNQRPAIELPGAADVAGV